MSLFRFSIIIITAMISTIEFSQGQMSSIYRYNWDLPPYWLSKQDHEHSHKSCYLCFYENGNYDISIYEQLTLDIVAGFILSVGKYSKKNNKITLIDKNNGYKIILLTINRNLKVEQGFKFLKNKMFNYSLYSDTKNSTEHTLFKNIDVSKERERQKQLNKKMLPFNCGTYKNEEHLKLVIQQDNNYMLDYKNIHISEGSWKRVGNEIVLYDPLLKCSFYVFVTDKGLNGKLLPGDFCDYLFHKQ